MYFNKFKLSMAVCSLIAGVSATSATITISDANTTALTISNGDSLTVTADGNLTTSGNPVTINTTAMDGNIQVNGTIESTDDEAIVINSGGINGSIINDGTITGSQDAIEIFANITGNITNNGTINAGGNTDESGIEVNDANVTGSITNTGTIIATGDNGIAVWGNNTAGESGYVNGGINNSGTITSEGEGLDIDDGSTIQNGITNSGTIQATSAVAIEIDEDSNVTGGITNTSTGVIKSTSTDAIEIMNGSTLSGGITNRGTIQGDADGIFMDNDGGSNPTLTGGITNYGVLRGGDDAIDINDASTISGGINNYGTIFGSDKSIDFGSSVVFSGGITNHSGGVIAGLISATPSGSADLNNSGSIYLKSSITYGSEATTGNAGTSELTGDYTQTSSGLLDFAFDSNATVGTTYSNFAITGDATFSDNAKLSIDVKNSDANLSNGMVFNNVVSATGTLTTTTFNVTDNSLAYKFTADDNGSAINITATTTGLTTVKAAVSGGTKGAGESLDNVTDGEVTNALGSLNTAAEVQDAVNQTLPVLTGDMAKATFDSMHAVNKVVQARMEGSTGLSSGDQYFLDSILWAKPYGSWAKQNDKDGVTGYSANSYGLVFGIDKELKDNQRFGMAFSYGNSNIEGNDKTAPQTSDVDIYQLIAYGTKDIANGYEANFQADISYNTTDGSRAINFGSLDKTAKFDYESLGFHIGTGVGHLYKLNDKESVTATARVDYTRIDDNGYTETGAGALNLTVNSKTSSELVAELGAKYVKTIKDNQKLTAKVGVGYDLHAGANSVVATYAGNSGSSFSVTGIKTEPWIVNAGLGLVQNTSKGIEITTDYNFEGREDFRNHSVSMKFRWPF